MTVRVEQNAPAGGRLRRPRGAQSVAVEVVRLTSAMAEFGHNFVAQQRLSGPELSEGVARFDHMQPTPMPISDHAVRGAFASLTAGVEIGRAHV